MFEFKTFNKAEVAFYISSIHLVIQERITPNEAYYYFLDKDTMIFRKSNGTLNALYGIGNFAEIGDTFYLEEVLPSYYA